MITNAFDPCTYSYLSLVYQSIGLRKILRLYWPGEKCRVDTCVVCLSWAEEGRVAAFLWCVCHPRLKNLVLSILRASVVAVPSIWKGLPLDILCVTLFKTLFKYQFLRETCPLHSFANNTFPTPCHSLYLFHTLLLFLVLMGIWHHIVYVCLFTHCLSPRCELREGRDLVLLSQAAKEYPPHTLCWVNNQFWVQEPLCLFLS